MENKQVKVLLHTAAGYSPYISQQEAETPILYDVDDVYLVTTFF